MSHPREDPLDPQTSPQPAAEGEWDLPGWQAPPVIPGPASPDALPAEEAGMQEDPPAQDAPAGPGGAGGNARSTRVSTKPTAKALGEAVTAVFRGAGELANHFAATDEQDEVWLPTDDEAVGVGAPAGRLIARRVPEMPGGADPSDIGDLVAMIVPLGVYVARNLADWLPRRRRKAKTVRGQVVAPAMEATQA